MTAGSLADYQVVLDTFRGPLDMLLYLVKRDEVDVLDIPIARVAEQFKHDLEVLTTIASQTGVALRTARLVSDLRTAGGSMRSLNRDLLQTKERLEKLDSVKTDFVTVASHELRTPLAQIRGYTDILETMNDQTMLNPDLWNPHPEVACVRQSRLRERGKRRWRQR